MSSDFNHGLGQRVVIEARRWIGTPYVHQASVLGAGADCLGLIRGIWRACIGPEPIQPPAYTRDWSEALGAETLMFAADEMLLPSCNSAPLPGDIILFRMREGAIAKHLGILSHPGPAPRFIHAYSGHGVVENSLSDPWKRRVVKTYRFPGEGI